MYLPLGPHSSTPASAPQEQLPLVPFSSQPWHAPGRGHVPGNTCAVPARRLCADRGRLLPLLTAGCVSARHSSSSTICSGFTPSWGQIRERRTGLCRSAWEESRAVSRAGSGWQEKHLVSLCKAVPDWFFGRVLSPTNMSHVQAPTSPRTALCPCASPPPCPASSGRCMPSTLQARVRNKRWLSRCVVHTAVRQSGRLPALYREKGNLVAGP